MLPSAPQTDSDLILWLTYFKELILFLGLIAAAFWAYAKIVIPDLFPLAQLDVNCKTLGMQHDRAILEILIIIKNIGSSAIQVKNLNIDLRYLRKDDKITEYSEQSHLLGRVYFPHNLKDEITKFGYFKDSSHRIELLKYRNFVRPHTEQTFAYITSVPCSTSFVRILASFESQTDITLLKRISIKLSRRLGLINYTLDSLSSPHVCERAFKVEAG